MSKIRFRLSIIFILLIGLSVLAAGIYTARMLKDSHINALRDHILREVRIITATVPWETNGTESDRMRYFTERAILLEQYAGARVTFIALDGQVLGDSDKDPLEMDNHLQRVEIVEAAQSGVGYSIRYSDTVKQNMLYVAVPVFREGAALGYVRLSMSLGEVEYNVRKLWSGLITGLLVLFLLVGLVSSRIAHNFTRPLERLTELAKQITLHNYKPRVQIRSKDEIGQLGRAINIMADSLQQQMNRIKEDESRLKSVLDTMVSGVVMIDKNDRIVLLNRQAEYLLGFDAGELLGRHYREAKQQYELMQLIQECIDKKEHIRDEIVFYYPEERMMEINLVPMVQEGEHWAGLVIVLHDISAVRRLEKMRSEFVANVSHELKTPIAAVQGFAETLLAGAVNDPDTAKSFLQIIYDESNRLNRLIGDILELSKIESKRVPLQFSPVRLNAFIENTMEMMKAEADKKEIQIHFESLEDVYIEADEDRLRQILINLLSNGINYTQEGGTVSIKVESDVQDGEAAQGNEQEKVTIVIRDTGIGIPKKDLPRIFERFYRVDKARSRSSGGTGLGLSIVKHLVELHKGSIRVDSIVGIGTTFYIELPVIQS